MEDTVVMPAFQMRSTFHIHGCLATLYRSVSKSPYNDTDFPLHYFTVNATQLHTPGDRIITTNAIKNHLCCILLCFRGMHTGFLFIIIICIIYSCLCLFIYKWQAECTLDCFLFYSRPKSRVNAMLVVDLYFT